MNAKKNCQKHYKKSTCLIFRFFFTFSIFFNNSFLKKGKVTPPTVVFFPLVRLLPVPLPLYIIFFRCSFRSPLRFLPQPPSPSPSMLRLHSSCFVFFLDSIFSYSVFFFVAQDQKFFPFYYFFWLIIIDFCRKKKIMTEKKGRSKTEFQVKLRPVNFFGYVICMYLFEYCIQWFCGNYGGAFSYKKEDIAMVKKVV